MLLTQQMMMMVMMMVYNTDDDLFMEANYSVLVSIVRTFHLA